MLNNLPLEILLKIARFLTIQEKLVLITTCRALHDLVTGTCFYKVVKIRPGHDAQAIVERLASNNAFRNQVKYLILESTALSQQVYLLLPDMFPRVTRFVDLSTKNVEAYRLGKVPSATFKVWSENFSQYKFQDDNLRLARLMQTEPFSRLTVLYASQFYRSNQRLFRVKIDLLECIKHVPLLRELFLDKCKINLEFIETMHAHCRVLRKLQLTHVLVDMGDAHYPSSIVPARLFTAFNVDASTVICDKHCFLLKYITEKYPRLHALKFISIFADFNFDALSLLFYGDNNQVIPNKRADHLETRRAYSHEGSRLLLRLPTSLQALFLNSPIFNNVVERLNQSSMKLKKLFIIEEPRVDTFETIQQLRYITKSNSLKYLAFNVNPALQSYTNITISNTVTVLTVSITENRMSKSIDIDWILSCFPVLQELKVFRSIILLTYGSDIYAGRVYPKLNRLRIFDTPTDIGLVQYIPTIAPNLKLFSWMVMNEYYMNRLASHFREWLVFRSSDFFKSMERGEDGYIMDLTSYHLDKIRLHLRLDHATSNDDTSICLAIKMESQTYVVIFSKKNFYSLETMTEGKPYIRNRNVTVKCNGFKKLTIDEHTLNMKDGSLSYVKK